MNEKILINLRCIRTLASLDQKSFALPREQLLRHSNSFHEFDPSRHVVHCLVAEKLENNECLKTKHTTSIINKVCFDGIILDKIKRTLEGHERNYLQKKFSIKTPSYRASLNTYCHNGRKHQIYQSRLCHLVVELCSIVEYRSLD